MFATIFLTNKKELNKRLYILYFCAKGYLTTYKKDYCLVCMIILMNNQAYFGCRIMVFVLVYSTLTLNPTFWSERSFLYYL